jgi:hypothetical protein
MATSLKDRFCVNCGQPAVDARVELDGTLTYFCAEHSPVVRLPDETSPRPEAPAHGKRNGG